MLGDVSFMDLAMAGAIVVPIFVVCMAVLWAVLRSENTIGPLAAAEQQAKIDAQRAEAVLSAKRIEAQIIQADAKLVEAKGGLAKAQMKALGMPVEEDEPEPPKQDMFPGGISDMNDYIRRYGVR